MALVMITKGYRVSSEDVIAMITVSEISRNATDLERANIQNDINDIIENARARGMYYQFTRGQEIVRTVLVMKNGMVFGTSVTGETISANMGFDKKTTGTRKKRP